MRWKRAATGAAPWRGTACFSPPPPPGTSSWPPSVARPAIRSKGERIGSWRRGKAPSRAALQHSAGGDESRRPPQPARPTSPFHRGPSPFPLGGPCSSCRSWRGLSPRWEEPHGNGVLPVDYGVSLGVKIFSDCLLPPKYSVGGLESFSLSRAPPHKGFQPFGSSNQGYFPVRGGRAGSTSGGECCLAVPTLKKHKRSGRSHVPPTHTHTHTCRRPGTSERKRPRTSNYTTTSAVLLERIR